MIQTSVYFYPDARNAATGIRVGSIVLGQTDENTWIYARYLLPENIEAAKARAAIQMRSLLDNLAEYLSERIESIDLNDGPSELTVCGRLIAQIGLNLRLSDPRPWPDDGIVALLNDAKAAGVDDVIASALHRHDLAPA